MMGAVSPPSRAPRPEPRGSYRAFTVTVTAAVSLTPRMRRITLHAPQLTDYELLRPDDFFALLIPGPAGLDLPADGLVGSSPRGVADLIGDRCRPELRWYTVRAHRPDDGEVDVDIVLHGDYSDHSDHDHAASGPGGRWAATVTPGDVAGFVEGNGLYSPTDPSGRQVFFADVTALPALSSILTSPEPAPGVAALGSQATAHIEVDHDSDIHPIATGATVHWHVRDGGPPGLSIPRVLDGVAPGEISYAWICAEASLVQEARRFLIAQGGVAKELITFSGYWRQGEART
ncbi:iron utilization protein [Dietzia sp. DQ12-45-1b]|nr:iron utilization protein [Dietzia sp. DQ12-45-1b]